MTGQLDGGQKCWWSWNCKRTSDERICWGVVKGELGTCRIDSSRSSCLNRNLILSLKCFQILGRGCEEHQLQSDPSETDVLRSEDDRI
jgi:hypothetical protein